MDVCWHVSCNVILYFWTWPYYFFFLEDDIWVGNCGWESGLKGCGIRLNSVASCINVSWWKHRTWGAGTTSRLAHIFSAHFPPTCWAQAVRIKLAARQLAELAGHIEAAAPGRDRAGRLKLACLLARGLVCGESERPVIRRSDSERLNKLAVSLRPKWSWKYGFGVSRQTGTHTGLCVRRRWFARPEHATRGHWEGLGERPWQRREHVCV